MCGIRTVRQSSLAVDFEGRHLSVVGNQGEMKGAFGLTDESSAVIVATPSWLRAFITLCRRSVGLGVDTAGTAWPLNDQGARIPSAPHRDAHLSPMSTFAVFATQNNGTFAQRLATNASASSNLSHPVLAWSASGIAVSIPANALLWIFTHACARASHLRRKLLFSHSFVCLCRAVWVADSCKCPRMLCGVAQSCGNGADWFLCVRQR